MIGPRIPRRSLSARLRLAGLAALAATGCRSLPARPAVGGARTEPAAPAMAKADPELARTAFRAEATPEQRLGVHTEMARAFESQGKDEAAVAEYQRALEAIGGRRGGAKVEAASRAQIHRRLGGALDRLGRFAQAESHYREALRLSPDDPKVWNDAGYSYFLRGRPKDAERALRTAARLAPEDPRVQTNLGLALASAGKLDDALEALTKAGGPAVARANLGYILAGMGRTEEARAHYRAALERQPELLPARYALARLDADAARRPGAPAPTSDAGLARASAAAGIPLPALPPEAGR